MVVRLMSSCAIALVLTIAAPSIVEAQLGGLIRRGTRAATDELGDQIEKTIREGVRCAVGDSACIERARRDGKTLVMTDANGKILTDAEGRPITDPAKVPPAATPTAAGAAAPRDRPGTGAWLNYDFVPGDTVLLYEDYTRDRIGNFPRRFGLVEGNWEIAEWQGSRFLRATANGAIKIALPATLPERFTMEFAASVQHPNASVRVSTSPLNEYKGSTPTLSFSQAGLRPEKDAGPTTLTRRRTGADRDALVNFRIMVDGDYMKMYLDDHRVANAPNAVFPRTEALYLSTDWNSDEYPILIGPVRIAAGGSDLYDRLDRDGRVATQGILFEADSAVIRPESTPTLSEIGTMLQSNADLRLTIEGHTDSQGDETYNQQLSEHRAQAVKAFLVATYKVDGGRLQTVGLGESVPVGDNATPEGRQQNRRVELVKR